MNIAIKILMIVGCLIQSHFAAASSCKSIEDVERVISENIQVSKSNENGILRDLVSPYSIGDIESLNIVTSLYELVFEMDKKLERFTFDYFVNDEEKYFPAAGLIRLPAIAKLKNGKIFEGLFVIYNNYKGKNQCVLGSTRFYEAGKNLIN